MPWLRLDDKFERHPKVSALNDRLFRTWLRTLLFCAEFRTRGVVPQGASIVGLSQTSRATFRARGLLDFIDGEDVVHDWMDYNPHESKAAERMRRMRAAKEGEQRRNSERNEGVTSPVTGSSPEASPSRARASGRAARTPVRAKALTSKHKEPDPLWDALVDEIGPVATEAERGRRNKALRDLRGVAATATQVRARCAVYREKWPTMTLTATALTANWSMLNGAEPCQNEASVRTRIPKQRLTRCGCRKCLDALNFHELADE